MERSSCSTSFSYDPIISSVEEREQMYLRYDETSQTLNFHEFIRIYTEIGRIFETIESFNAQFIFKEKVGKNINQYEIGHLL